MLATDPNDPALGGNIIGGDPNTYHPALWDYLIDRFAVGSMLDVGCGEGHCVEYFQRAGVMLACGIDGLRLNIDRAVIPITLHDLRQGSFKVSVDLVHCCEVVEHIEEKYIDYLLATLSNGRIIAMTHAVPGQGGSNIESFEPIQGGHHHVNCQPSSYWINKLEQRGYRFLAKETEEGRARIRAAGHWTYFMHSGLIFERAK